MNVLLIEDETETLEALASYLRLHDLTVYEASTLTEASRVLQALDMDVIVLDIELPDGCGLTWLKQNPVTSHNAGLIIVSAHHEERTRLKGLELGADAFLRKPLAARELYLQLENLSARLHKSPTPAPPAGAWSLNRFQWLITSPSGKNVTLTLSEIQMLQTLARWSGHPVPRIEIIKGLGADPISYDERRLETLIRRLRQKVREETEGQSLPLITVRGVGYAFKAGLRVIDD